MPVHVEYAKRTFNVLALSTKNCNVFSLGHRYSIPVFPFLLTETSHYKSILLILFHFSDNMSYPCKRIL